MMNAKYEKQDVKTWLLLLDVAVTLIMLGSAFLLIYNSFLAGQKLERGRQVGNRRGRRSGARGGSLGHDGPHDGDSVP